MATFIRLTRPGSTDPIFVNADQVTCFFREGSQTRIFFIGDEDKIDVQENVESVAMALGYTSA